MSSKRKWLVLLVAVLGGVVGYGAVAKAWPSPYHYGYFTNQYDSSQSGTSVWPASGGPTKDAYNGIFGYVRDGFSGSEVRTNGCQGSGGLAVPTWVDTPADFTDFVFCKAYWGSTQEQMGARFIVGTIIGTNNLSFLNDGNNFFAVWGEFTERVNYASAQGWINWGYDAGYGSCPASALPNTYYNSSKNDEFAFNSNCGNPDMRMILFSTPSGTYRLKRYCANPLGTMPALPDPPTFDMSGRSTVNDTTAVPGQTLTFDHYLKNNGPNGTSPVSIDYVIRNTVNGSQTLSGTAGTFTNGEERNVRSHTVTVAADAVIGSQICRGVEWSPDTSAGGSGAGTPACATVVAPAVTSACGSMTINPGTPDPSDPYTITAVVNTSGGSAGAQSVLTGGGQFYINVSGPGVNSSNSNVTPVTVGSNGSNGTLTASRAMSATNNAGTYTVSYGLTGAVTASCSSSFTISYSPYFSVMGGDVAAGPGFGTACTPKLSTIKGKNLGVTSGYYGAGSQLGAFALGQITNFATNTTLNVTPNDSLPNGSTMYKGDRLYSPNGRFMFIYQSDGNLVVYYGSTVMWHSVTYGQASTRLIMQNDGNLVLYNGSTPVWHTSTNGQGSSVNMFIQNDGQLALWKGGSSVWASGNWAPAPSNTGIGGSSSGTSAAQPSGLTFSNNGTSGTIFGTTFGKNPTEDTSSNATWCAPDYYNAATSGATPLGTSTLTQAVLNTLTSGTTYSTNGTLTISGPITLGGSSPKRIKIVSDGNVVITGNITYSGYNYVSANVNLGDIPQFQVLARGSIYVDKAVTTLTGFYHAQAVTSPANRGGIYTCSSGSKYLTGNSGDTSSNAQYVASYYTDCSGQLTIYGSVASSYVKLNRTGGNWKTAGSVTSRPAEQIIYAPELWLGTLSSTLPSTPQYDAITSLPPIL